MTENLKKFQRDALQAIANVESLSELEQLRIVYLGKKGSLTGLMKNLATLDSEARRVQGIGLNQLKDEIIHSFTARKIILDERELNVRLALETLDVSLAGRPVQVGRLHPISQTIDELVAIFGDMGFSVAEGPEIEDDFHNFTALNIPPSHPARQMHDTFYLRTPADSGGKAMPPVLRTHTSPVQIRTLKAGTPPVRIIAPGRTYRSDSDHTHTPMFHQVEGLMVDETIHMGHLKGCLIDFIHAFFEDHSIPVRFRASHFPFTEPSAELDIGYGMKDGVLKIGQGEQWLEILGCGMVHPHVLKACDTDSEKYQGFAFGIGIERLAMLKYGIPDLRTFFGCDLRWMQHYGFMPYDIASTVRGLGL